MKKIFLCGNMCSGKTIVAHMICKELKIPVFSIDDFRRMYNSQVNIPGEHYAWTQFLKIIDSTPRSAIIESTGLSKQLRGWRMENQNRLINILVKASPEACIKRYSKRSTYIPFPYNYSTTEESIIKMDTMLNAIPYDLVILNNKNIKDINVNYDAIQQLLKI